MTRQMSQLRPRVSRCLWQRRAMRLACRASFRREQINLDQRFPINGGSKTIQYRYSAAAFVGPWREDRARAERDAHAAGQALRDQKERGKIVLREWVTVEERDDSRHP